MPNSAAYNIYKTNSINYASKDQLLLMLLNGAVKFSKIARQAMADKDIENAHKNIMKVENIFSELIATLDVKAGGKWAEDLESVYYFIIRRLTQANVKKDVKIMDEVLPLIEYVKDMWTEAYKTAKGETCNEEAQS